MPTRETENASLGTATKQVAEHASSLARLELELAQLELKRKFASLGVGIGLGVGSAIFGLFMLGFLFAAIAAGLSTAMPGGRPLRFARPSSRGSSSSWSSSLGERRR